MYFPTLLTFVIILLLLFNIYNFSIARSRIQSGFYKSSSVSRSSGHLHKPAAVQKDLLQLHKRIKTWRFNRRTGKYQLVNRRNRVYACSLRLNNQIRTRRCPRRRMLCRGETLDVIINGTPAYYTFCAYYFTRKPDLIRKAIRKACFKATRLKFKSRLCRNKSMECSGGPMVVTLRGRPVTLKFCVKKGAIFDPLTVFGNNLVSHRKRRKTVKRTDDP